MVRERVARGTVEDDCTPSGEASIAFVRSVLSWHKAGAINASPPCPTSLLLGMDLEEVAGDPAAAMAWADFLAFMAGNFEKLIGEAVHARGEAHHAELEKRSRVLAALVEARGYAEFYAANFAASRVSRPFARSLWHWEFAIVAASGDRAPLDLVASVDLEKAAVDLDGARAWLDFLASVAERIARLRADAKANRVECSLANADDVLAWVQWAYDDAEEHFASLGGTLPQEEIIAERRLSVVGDPTRTVAISISRPRHDVGDDWICRAYVDGIRGVTRYSGRGVDALEALLCATDGARLEIDRSGLTLRWNDQEPGDIGLPNRVPRGLGLAFAREMEDYITTELRRRVIAAGGRFE